MRSGISASQRLDQTARNWSAFFSNGRRRKLISPPYTAPYVMGNVRSPQLKRPDPQNCLGLFSPKKNVGAHDIIQKTTADAMSMSKTTLGNRMAGIVPNSPYA